MTFHHLGRLAMALALVALNGCAIPFLDDAKPSGFDYAKAGEIAARQQQFNQAEEQYLRSAAEYEREGIYVDHVYGSLSRIYFTQGRYDEALAVRARSFMRGKDRLSLRDLCWHFLFIGQTCMAQGKYDEAGRHLQEARRYAQEKRRAEPQNQHFEVIQLYPTLGNYYLEIGERDKGRTYLQEYLTLYLKDSPASKYDHAAAKNGLARADYVAGDDTAAENLCREAAGMNTGAFVCFSEDLAQSLTMMGRIAEHRNDPAKALEHYQAALRALRSARYSPLKVEQADVLNPLGRFQLRQAQPDQAEQAFREAIALRQQTASTAHPNCADAIKGLADVAAFRGELTTATAYATKALAVLDAAVVPTHPRTGQELVALASIHRLAGRPQEAAALDARLEILFQKPLGPWKEDFLQTVELYAGLLKKAGKTADAARLEKIYAQQKEKR